MGDLFGAFQKVSPQNKNNSFDQIAAYEEYYMKLLKRYQGDIQNIEEMMENLRKERKDFYLKELPAIQKAMVEMIKAQADNIPDIDEADYNTGAAVDAADFQSVDGDANLPFN